MIIKRQKHVIKQRTKICTKALYFILKLDLNSTNHERRYNKEFVKGFILSSKVIYGEALVRSGGWKKFEKLISGGGYLLGT